MLRYAAIVHQVVTYAALVAIWQDCNAGALAERPVEVGVIQFNARDNSIAPF